MPLRRVQTALRKLLGRGESVTALAPRPTLPFPPRPPRGVADLLIDQANDAERRAFRRRLTSRP